ncbi:MAG: HNH endonuclease [Lactobacillales bacterium]|nr:HNH endonuclease [Lactobacillales bacterium]
MNEGHETFVAHSSGKPYMEAHHLVPISYQPLFEHGIDVVENISCLCPCCHRLLHYGTPVVRDSVVESLFDKQAGGFERVGIEITKKELKTLY